MEPDEETPEWSGHWGGHQTAGTQRLLIPVPWQMPNYHLPVYFIILSPGWLFLSQKQNKMHSSSCLRSQDQKGGNGPVKHSACFEHAHLIMCVWLTICGTFGDQPSWVCSELLPLKQPSIGSTGRNVGAGWLLLKALKRIWKLWVNQVLVYFVGGGLYYKN